MGGLHRSGTTLLGRMLADHPDISGFEGTGVLEDEGQHLQSVYAPARHHGGPGRFARRPASHLTEVHESESTVLAQQLLAAWTPHWDTRRDFLVEKSPPNMLMGRYLQSIFPGSALIVILRHPLVVSLSTKKWTRTTSLPNLVDHWFHAHDILRRDASNLRRLHVIRYEDLMAAPAEALQGIRQFLGLRSDLATDRLEPARSNRYVESWNRMEQGSRLERLRRRRIEKLFGDRMQEYGYDIDDLTRLMSWDFREMR
ncbi:sulfotransferase family protein [Ornithinimicrobium murale]|uniref:sulfotransferase family protein n=1 Tax=Ornithinimicrobium murale TaxID=1050153 RepID=UPI0013B3D8A2|nr:sulfotransferase [Ornithinimicrobium murale]